MTKLIIKVEKQTKIIDEAFDEMATQNVWKTTQAKVFKAVYKSRVNGLFGIIKRRLRGWITEETNNSFSAVEEGTDEIIEQRRKDFEKFLFGSENELKDQREYKQFKSDRIVFKILRSMKGGIKRTKEKALALALGGDQVIDFFNRVGIYISWKVEK